jgi:DNA-binding response OmpR family regulator
MQTPASPLVLIVDDEPAIRHSLARFLEQAGYEAVFADDVDPALDVLTERPVAALVLDLGLPSRTGLEVLSFLRLHQHSATLPVLILTGSILSVEEAQYARNLGARTFLKPEGYRAIVRYLDDVVRGADAEL